jgi:hypothetical protein
VEFFLFRLSKIYAWKESIPQQFNMIRYTSL